MALPVAPWAEIVVANAWQRGSQPKQGLLHCLKSSVTHELVDDISS